MRDLLEGNCLLEKPVAARMKKTSATLADSTSSSAGLKASATRWAEIGQRPESLSWVLLDQHETLIVTR